MEPVLDEGVLQIRGVVVDRVYLCIHVLLGAILVEAYLAEHVQTLDELVDPGVQHRTLVLLHRSTGVEILLQHPVQVHELVVPAGTRHRRAHVPYEDRVYPALALDPLTWIVDDVRVNVRHRVQDHIRVVVGREGVSLPGEPLQGPVGPHVDDQVRPVVVLEPSVEGQILMGHHHARVMVQGLRLVVMTAVGLRPDEDVTVPDPGYYELSLVDRYGTWRVPPAADDSLPRLFGDRAVPFQVAVQRD